MNQTAPKTIVIVDDTPENLRLLVEMLSEQGYRVRPAPSGERALASIHKEVPDLILLDILMPEMNGFEVARRLQSNVHTRDVPIIFISALNEVFDKVTAFSVGGVDYITKPFQIEEVLARVDTHISLRDARLRLEEQNRELEAFAHTVAHDLKNPLGTLIGFQTLLIESDEPLSAEARRLADMAVASAFKINNIIDELLLLASVRKEHVILDRVDMNHVVQNAFNRLGHMMNHYQPEVIVPDSWPEVRGYAPWVEEVWVNYLSNGLKYGGTPPRLQLGADYTDDGNVRFWVADNGAGLTPEEQVTLFTEFTRLDKVRAQGHGLGLSIVRRIMDKLGGKAGVESSGAGSLFFFALPHMNT
ncbi:MAG: hybrid sensor histidine kinase/response regulator [Anaerolineae bacterium]